MRAVAKKACGMLRKESRATVAHIQALTVHVELQHLKAARVEVEKEWREKKGPANAAN